MISSDLADWHYKPAHYFWSWLGMILAIPVSIIFLFYNWIQAIVIFVIGISIILTARRSATEFVLENMLSSETFWNYVLSNKGAIIEDNMDNELTSDSLIINT